MPQPSYEYAIGRIKTLENHILDFSKLKKLEAIPLKDLLKTLQDNGYGNEAVADDNVENVMKEELFKARMFIKDITPEPKITDLFSLHLDAHNIKTLFKARILKEPYEGILLEGGMFSLEFLEKCVNDQNYFLLPKVLKAHFEELEKVLLRQTNPQVISSSVDIAIFAYIEDVIKQTKNEYAKKYFSMLVDFTNIRSFLRVRVLEWEVDHFVSLLLPGGYLTKSDFISAYPLPNEQLALALAKGPHAEKIIFAIEEYISKDSILVFEKRMDTFLMQLVRAAKYNVNSIAPIVGYLIGKEAEAKAIRIIYAAKRDNVESDLPELYI